MFRFTKKRIRVSPILYFLYFDNLQKFLIFCILLSIFFTYSIRIVLLQSYYAAITLTASA